MAAPDRIVVMGPSGNGKSSLASVVAARLGWRFVEGDDHHPPKNIAKMARGEPLDDADRGPFLHSIGMALREAKAVAACSALKRAYRDMLREVAGKPILFVLPRVSPAELQRRMQGRAGHFMPPSLLASQLAALELPGADELHLMLDGTRPATELAQTVADLFAQD